MIPAKPSHIDAVVDYLSENGCTVAGLGESPIPVNHTFTPGLYIRECVIPADFFLVTKIHKQQHPFIITKGRVLVHDGEDAVLLEAPYRGITEPGTQRVIYALEDTTWITFHPTDKTDPVEVEQDIIEQVRQIQ